jgi:hypothetical protein
MCKSTPKPKPPKPAPVQPPVAPPVAPEVKVGSTSGTATKRKKISRSDLGSPSSSAGSSGLGV